jgi:hypothetical protein
MTDDSGRFTLNLYDYYSRDKLRIIVHDADSTGYGAYQDTAFIIPASIVDFKRRGEGHWHIDYEYKDPLMIKLRNTGTPPCKEKPLTPDSTMITSVAPADTINIELIPQDTAVNGYLSAAPMKDTLLQPLIKVYPNPNNGYFTLEWESAFEMKAELYIYDDRYRLISSKEIHIIKGMNRIMSEMIEYPSGTYFLKIIGGNINFNIKLIHI